MSVDPKMKLTELDEARYRVIRLLMQSEDLLYLQRLEEQLQYVLSPEQIAKEDSGESITAASLVLTKDPALNTSEETIEYALLKYKKKPGATKEGWAKLVGVTDHIEEDADKNLVETD